MSTTLTGGGADVTGEVTPAQRLDALTADPKWAQALLAGGGTQMRELQELLVAKSAGGDLVGQVIDGTAKEPLIETVTDGALTVHKQKILAAQLRAGPQPSAQSPTR